MGAESKKDPGGIGTQSDCCSPSDIECVRRAWVEVTQKKTGFVYVHLKAWEKEWRYSRKTVKLLRTNNIIVISSSTAITAIISGAV